MPHIRMRGIQNHHIQDLSASLPKPLSTIMQTSEDNFTVESLQTIFYTQGKPTLSYPFVEVFWFARPQEVQNEAAKEITKQVKALTQAEDVVVVFMALEKNAYYENGTHF